MKFVVFAPEERHPTYRAMIGGADQVVFARTKRELVDQVRTGEPDVVVAHARYRGSDAYSACAEVRRMPAANRVGYVIAYTPEETSAVTAHQRMRNRADAYLMEPFDAGALSQAVAEASRRRTDSEPPRRARERILTVALLARTVGILLILGGIVLTYSRASPGLARSLGLLGWMSFTAGAGFDLAARHDRGVLRWSIFVLSLLIVGVQLFIRAGQ